jgi:hypothetical protein
VGVIEVNSGLCYQGGSGLCLLRDLQVRRVVAGLQGLEVVGSPRCDGRQGLEAAVRSGGSGKV